jgi:hypothetical protein
MSPRRAKVSTKSWGWASPLVPAHPCRLPSTCSLPLSCSQKGLSTRSYSHCTIIVRPLGYQWAIDERNRDMFCLARFDGSQGMNFVSGQVKKRNRLARVMATKASFFSSSSAFPPERTAR